MSIQDPSHREEIVSGTPRDPAGVWLCGRRFLLGCTWTRQQAKWNHRWLRFYLFSCFIEELTYDVPTSHFQMGKSAFMLGKPLEVSWFTNTRLREVPSKGVSLFLRGDALWWPPPTTKEEKMSYVSLLWMSIFKLQMGFLANPDWKHHITIWVALNVFFFFFT